MKILFIGGTGVISSSITNMIKNTEHELYLLNRGSGQNLENNNIKFIKADINNREETKKILENYKFDTVVDFICYTREQAMFDYELFKDKTNQFIFISSASCYQKPAAHYIIDESTPLKNPFWDYSQEKIECEDFFMEKYIKEDFPITIVRPSHTYAKNKIPIPVGGAKTHWTYVHMILNGDKFIAPGDGTTLWTITHAEDFAKGFIGLLGNPATIGNAFNITSDEVLTWNDIMNQIGNAVGKKVNIVHMSTDYIVSQNPEFSGPLYGDKANCGIFDNSKLKRFVKDYNPTIRFDEGIKKVVDYMNTHKEEQVVDYEYIEKIRQLIKSYEG